MKTVLSRQKEARTMENIKSNKQKEKILQKSERSLRDVWNTIKPTNICIVGNKEKERERAERISEEIRAEIFPYLMEVTNIYIQETQ